jgi:hypothetical protein
MASQEGLEVQISFWCPQTAIESRCTHSTYGASEQQFLQWLRNGPSFELPKRWSQDQLRDLQLECDFYQLDALKDLVAAAAVIRGQRAPVQYKVVTDAAGRGELTGAMDRINNMVADGWRVHSVAGGSYKETLMYKAM